MIDVPLHKTELDGRVRCAAPQCRAPYPPSLRLLRSESVRASERERGVVKGEGKRGTERERACVSERGAVEGERERGRERDAARPPCRGTSLVRNNPPPPRTTTGP